jgi:RNA 3'-terminal phosphate cyclase (ATP)
MAILGAPIVIDGSHGEGGGALLRTALVMASITQQPLRVVNIRGGTKFPGLNPEDLTLLRALALCTSAEVLGGSVGESSLSYLPTRRPKAMNERLEIAEAYEGPGFANALVVLNSLAPILVRTGAYSKLNAVGETHGHNMLSYDYFANVTLQAYRRAGAYMFSELSLAGFGRSARGEVRLEIEPSHIEGLKWRERGQMLSARAVVATGELPENVAQRGVAHLRKLGHNAGIELEADFIQTRSKTTGAYVTVWGEYENGLGGGTAMGARGVRIEAVAQQAFEGFYSWMKGNATVDPYLADQILIMLAIAEGESEFKTPLLTQRFLTSVWVIKQFLPIHITVRGQEGEPGTVSIYR